METIKFTLLPDLVLIELFSYFTSVELLHSFWPLTTRLDTLLFECNVIRHVDWLKLSDYQQDMTRDRLLSVASLTTDCFSIAEPLLKRKTLRRLSLVNVFPSTVMNYVWTDWRHGLDGLREINFIAVNTLKPSTSDLGRTGIFLAYLIGYVDTLQIVRLPPCYTLDSFEMPPISIADVQCCKYDRTKLSFLHSPELPEWIRFEDHSKRALSSQATLGTNYAPQLANRSILGRIQN